MHLFFKGCLKKSCALLLCVFGSEASPQGNTERLWREGNPPGKATHLRLPGNTERLWREGNPPGKAIDLRLPGNTERLWREGNPPGEVVSTLLGKNTCNSHNTRKMQLCKEKHELTTSPLISGNWQEFRGRW